MDPSLISTLVTGGIGLISTAAGYLFGRRTKVDEIRIKRGYELAEQVVSLFEAIHELYSIEQLYDANFGHLEDPRKAADSFEKLPGLNGDEKDRITDLKKKRGELRQLIKGAAIYIRHDELDLIRKYLETGDIIYETDGGLFIDTYLEEFFRNLADQNLRKTRLDLYKRFHKNVRRLV